MDGQEENGWPQGKENGWAVMAWRWEIQMCLEDEGEGCIIALCLG